MLDRSKITDKLSNYPLLIVKPLIKATEMSVTDPGSAFSALVDSSDLILRLIAFYLLAVYRAKSEKEPKIEDSLPGIVAKPAMGSYMGLIRLFSKYLRSSDPTSMKLLEALKEEADDSIVENLRHIEEIEIILKGKMLPKKKKERIVENILGGLVTFRNKIEGHAATKNPAELVEISRVFYEIQIRLLEILEPFSTIQIVSVENQTKIKGGTEYTIYKWVGNEPHLSRLSGVSNLIPGHVYFEVQSDKDSTEYLDTTPFLLADKKVNSETEFDLYVLNGSSKHSLEMLSYQTGFKLTLDHTKPFYPEAAGILAAICTITDDSFEDRLKISTAARANLLKGEVLLREDDDEEALTFFESAVELSPAFAEAIERAVSIHLKLNNVDEAIRILDNYLDWMSPVSVEINAKLLESAICLHLERDDIEHAQSLLKSLGGKVLDDNIKSELEQKLVGRETHGSETVDLGKESTHLHLASLPQEIFSYLIFRTMQYPILLYSLLITCLTAFLSLVFYEFEDVLMAVTIITMGLLWLGSIWSAKYIRDLIVSSEPNMCAFLIYLRENPRRFKGLVESIFGSFFYAENRRLTLSQFVKLNKIIIWECSIISLVISYWFINATMDSVLNPWVNVIYFFYMFLLFQDVVYLSRCIFRYYKLLNTKKMTRSSLSLVQHPKLSIKYLSYLNQKIFVPLLVLYVIFIFLQYLGPFKANVSWVVIMTLVFFSITYSYYSNIVLIHRAIARQKWSNLAKLSKHFDAPFQALISKAQIKQLDRIHELIKIRDFVSSFRTLPISVTRLILFSLFLFTILIGTIIGLSNLLPNRIVPILTRNYLSENKKSVSQDFPISDPKKIRIQVDGVDDTFLVLWKAISEREMTSETELENWDTLDQTKLKEGKLLDLPRVTEIFGDNDKLFRCDWNSGGEHGKLDRRISLFKHNHSKDASSGNISTIIFIAYNKIYHSKFLLGGGKLSYNLKLSIADTVVYQKRVFVRDNSKGIKQIILVQLRQLESKGTKFLQVYATTNLQDPLVTDQIKRKLTYINNRLNREKDAEMIKLFEEGNKKQLQKKGNRPLWPKGKVRRP